MRIHVKQLLVRTEGPDRKQRYKVVFAGPACGWPLKLEEAEWLDLQPLLETLRGSGVELSQD
jgi:hypothetical protein